MYFDLRMVCYEDFLDFIFDHPVAPQFCGPASGRHEGPVAPWYDSIELDVDFDPARNCEFLTLLFCDARELPRRYSPERLEQGFWWMQKSYNDGSAADVLWTSSLPVHRRIAMVEAMYFLCAELFADAFLPGHALQMWWGNLTRSSPARGRAAGCRADRRLIEDKIFETLVRLLDLESETCRIQALHGLRQIAHPERARAIREYLNRYDGFDEDHRRYA